MKISAKIINSNLITVFIAFAVDDFCLFLIKTINDQVCEINKYRPQKLIKSSRYIESFGNRIALLL
ncbi:MAG: hypothetical protein ABFD00_04080 [Chloroherpetonaceae bacterium]